MAKTFPASKPAMQIDHALGRGRLPEVVGFAAVELPVSDHRALVVDFAGGRSVGSPPWASSLLETRRGASSPTASCASPPTARGLRIPFAYDDESQLVTAEFTLGPEFSGVPRYVHGGVVLAILDEAMAWAAIAAGGPLRRVHQTATTFDRPVKVGSAYRVEASVQTSSDAAVTTRAAIFSASLVTAPLKATQPAAAAAPRPTPAWW